MNTVKNNIQEFSKEILELGLYHPYDTCLLIVSDVLAPRASDLMVQTVQTAHGNKCGVEFQLVNRHTSLVVRPVDLNNCVARVALQGYGLSNDTVEFLVLESYDLDDYAWWQLMDKVCVLADKYRVNLSIETDAFTHSKFYKGRKTIVKKEVAKRLYEYFNFIKTARNTVFRHYQKKLTLPSKD